MPSHQGLPTEESKKKRKIHVVGRKEGRDEGRDERERCGEERVLPLSPLFFFSLECTNPPDSTDRIHIAEHNL